MRIRNIFRADRVVGPYAAGFRFPVFRRGGRLCPPAGCTGFTVIFGEFDTFPWADVGIGPYRVSANSYCPAGFKRKTFLTQLFKRNYLQICCTVTGSVYHSAPFLPILFRQGGKEWAAGGTSETASPEQVSAMREASYPLRPFPPFQNAKLRWFAFWGLASPERALTLTPASSARALRRFLRWRRRLRRRPGRL